MGVRAISVLVGWAWTKARDRRTSGGDFEAEDLSLRGRAPRRDGNQEQGRRESRQQEAIETGVRRTEGSVNIQIKRMSRGVSETKVFREQNPPAASKAVLSDARIATLKYAKQHRRSATGAAATPHGGLGRRELRGNYSRFASSAASRSAERCLRERSCGMLTSISTYRSPCPSSVCTPWPFRRSFSPGCVPAGTDSLRFWP